MFDVFYSGIKPNLFAHEQAVDNIGQAQELSKTRYFWWVNYLSDYSDFDFSFEPVPWEAQYTHTWPSQHHEYSGTYLVPKAGNIEYKFHTQVIPNKEWHKNYTKLVNNINFDYTWHPHPFDPPYIYVFGNQWYPSNIMPTVEYHVAGATERKFMTQPVATLPEQHNNNWRTLIDCEFDYSWVPDPGDPPYTYVFGNQWHRAEIMPTVEYHVEGAVERKYIHYPRAKLLADKTLWTVPAGIDQDEIDFSWVPDPGSPPYIYQFATQHQRTGGPQYRMPGAVDTKYIDQIKVRTDRVASALYEIDHMDGNSGQIPNTTKRVRYFDNYLDTLKRIANSISDDHEFIWICSSVCDYTNFDFTWHPEQWQATMLHVFPSDGEKFGDTFFMHVPTFKYRSEKCQLLEWYDLNFTNINVPRRLLPVVKHTYDTHVEAIKTLDWHGPLAIFSAGTSIESIPTVPLWREKTKTIVPLSPGASNVIVPKVAVPYIKTQGYDYPNIDKQYPYTNKSYPSNQDRRMDIVFIDNNEKDADYNYHQLKWSVERADENRIYRSSGVNGRAAAYKAAAELSTTPWFFAVFAKLHVNDHFDWSFQPDRLQEPKHYIFHAKNPVNGLEYGHQGMILYNKKLVLENTAQGLDFTLDQAHEVVPHVSGTAQYDMDPWTCWRTAFRECIKLKASLPDVENEWRLTQWLTIDNTDDKWSMKGAEDAVEYYDAVNGEFSELKKSYDWEWLSTYAFIKRNLIQNQ